MTDEVTDRQKNWQPQPRPDWVKKINEEGRYMDIKSVVPLDENSLISTAKANVGLDDFGDDDWHEPFQVYVKSLNDEGNLNLMGRMMARSDLLVYLQARLKIEDTFKKHPEILDEEIEQMLYIIGQGRSGTTFLQDMLAEDPDNGTILGWETMFSCPPPEKATYHSDPRIEKAQHLIGQLSRVTPEAASVHEMGATIATESVQLHSLTFRSVWLLCFVGIAPSYAAYLAQQDMVPVYEYEKKVLKLLQWKNPRKRWIMKAPASIAHIPQIQKVYDNVSFILPHRDPVKCLSSLINTITTICWSRTDDPLAGNVLGAYTNPEISAMLLEMPIKLLESGELLEENLCNLHFKDIIKQPLDTVKDIYKQFSIPMTEESEKALQAFIDENSHNSAPKHKYDTGESAQVSEERKIYQHYQDYFNVPNEF